MKTENIVAFYESKNSTQWKDEWTQQDDSLTRHTLRERFKGQIQPFITKYEYMQVWKSYF